MLTLARHGTCSCLDVIDAISAFYLKAEGGEPAPVCLHVRSASSWEWDDLLKRF